MRLCFLSAFLERNGILFCFCDFIPYHFQLSKEGGDVESFSPLLRESLPVSAERQSTPPPQTLVGNHPFGCTRAESGKGFLHPAPETFNRYETLLIHTDSFESMFCFSFFVALQFSTIFRIYPRKKPLESGPSRRAVKLGYLCHFVKLLSVLIYVRESICEALHRVKYNRGKHVDDAYFSILASISAA